MNSVCRVMDAIRGRPAAPVPRGELTVAPAFARDYLIWRDDGIPPDRLSDTEQVVACCRALGLDLLGIPVDETPGHGSVGATPEAVSRFAAAGLCVFALVDGAFQTAVAGGGMMTLLLDIARSPEAVGNTLRQLCGQVVAVMARAAAAGVHGIIVADDIAHSRNTFMAPDFVARYLLPVWRVQVAVARDLKVPVLLHSDGRLHGVLPHIAAAGFDGLCGLEPAAGMDVREVRKGFGGRLCLMGMMDPRLLVGGQEGRDARDVGDDRLTRSVAEAMKEAAEAGGLIFGTCSGLYAGLSPERVDAMYRLASELDKGVGGAC